MFEKIDPGFFIKIIQEKTIIVVHRIDSSLLGKMAEVWNKCKTIERGIDAAQT